MRHVRARVAILAISTISLLFAPSLAFSNGTETLGPPDIAIAMGSGTVLAGTGLADGQPADIEIDVPGAVVQVLLYWEGQTRTDRVGVPDDTIEIEGIPVQGALIGGPTQYIGPFISSTFRADITGLGLIGPGFNTVAISGMDFSTENDGAGILVIYDDGTTADLDIRDGNDFAFVDRGDPIGITVRQDFSFAPALVARTAEIDLFVASVADDTGHLGFRPSSIEVTVDGLTTVHSDLLNSVDEVFWDTHKLTVPVPAGAMDISVQLFSRNDAVADPETREGCISQTPGECPASMVWITASFAIMDIPSDCEIEVEKTCCIPAPAAPGLDQCEGKALELVFEYTGDSCAASNNDQSGKAKCSGDPDDGEPVSIVFSGKHSAELVATPSSGIMLGDEVRITRNGGSGELKASTKFDILGGAETQKLTIHTSCSKALGLGDQFGSMLLVELTSTEGGTVSDEGPTGPAGSACDTAPPSGTECDSRPVEVVFEYIGLDCAVPLANPQEGKATCNGDPSGVPDVSISYTGKDPGQIRVMPETGINVGDLIRVTATGRDDLHADTKLQILDTTVLQELKIHTSCSKPLFLGDVFGSLRLVEFTDKNGVTSSELAQNPTDPVSECSLASTPPEPHCDSKVEVLNLSYVGGDCSDTTNTQGGKATCSGGSAGEPVRVVAFNDGSLLVDTGLSVALGDTVALNAADVGRTELKPNTDVEVYDAADMLIHSLTIHTSCSKPLNLGDVFGAFEVESLHTTGGGFVGLGGVVEYQYVVTNPTGDAVVVDVDDDKLGEIASGLVIPAGESVTLYQLATVEETTTNVATVTATQGGSTCEAEASATVTVEEAEAVLGSCADGKPRLLVFSYTGEECAVPLANPQEGKASCGGPLMGEEPVEVVYTGGDSDKIGVVEGGEVIEVGDSVTLEAFGTSKLKAESLLEVRQGGVVLQSLNIHTSCSKALVVGDQFGALILQEFVPEN